MGLSGNDVIVARVKVADLEKRELEVLFMVLASLSKEISKLNVPAVSVLGVGRPALPYTLSPVCAPHVVSAVRSVRDQVNASNVGESCAPRRVCLSHYGSEHCERK